jgi:hypothetical protein
VINSFTAVPDCVFPDPRRHILSYRVSGGIVRAQLYATYCRPAGGVPSMATSGVQDPGAASDIESYFLRVTGEGGADVRRVVFFRYRRAAFDLLPPAFHTRVTRGTGTLARYQSHAKILNVDSVSCSFKFDERIGGTSGRTGRTAIVTPETDPDSVQCDIRWRSGARQMRPARASGQHG